MATRSARLTALIALVLVMALAATVAWRTPEVRAYVQERLSGATPSAAENSAPIEEARVVYEEQAVASGVEGDPTVLFAHYRSLYLYLPVAGEQLSEIAFHQASGDHAQHMEPLLPYADVETAMENHGTGRTVDDACCPDNPHMLGGEALRMWRSNRSGAPDTAVDVGADPGTAVYAPVSGTVLEVREYNLYGQYPDYEIHITPNGWPELDVVLIHVDDVQIAAGDQVVGGITQIATIRNLSDDVTLQLAQFDAHGGNHTHMQVNKLDTPGVLPELNGS